jgi:hypothetical protein
MVGFVPRAEEGPRRSCGSTVLVDVDSRRRCRDSDAFCAGRLVDAQAILRRALAL